VHGLMIHTAYAPLEGYKKIDQIILDYPNISMQNRHLIANSICKAVDIVYIHVFKKKMEKRGRLIHVSKEKISDRLITMCKHVFMWFGCGDSIDIYRISISFNETGDAG
jgi:hypothetical protein